MSRYRELSEHLHGLEDIRAILSSMRTLAAVELQRVSRLQDVSTQLRVGMEDAVAVYYNDKPRMATRADSILQIILGSEKGLCGDFNENLLSAVDGNVLVLVGTRLVASAQRLPQVAARCPGALGVDDVASVLATLAQTLAGLGNMTGNTLQVICHDPQQRQVRKVTVLPPEIKPSRSSAPYLQLPAQLFEAELLEQYLLAMFNSLLLDSLLAENQQRVAHLQSALQRLDERCETLRQRQRRARQEQIIEEVEVALAIDSTLDANPGHARQDI
jgi:F-type H+-transporting ATPase subunit gamma